MRQVVCLLLIGACVLSCARAAIADGDPASDTLYGSNLYVPYPPPSSSLLSPLEQAIAGAYKRGFRVKVAVIATQNDLGSVPELFGHPKEYAKFLGLELSQVYIGPLLIVMPAGFGIYDGGRSTAAEQAVLTQLPAPDPSLAGLMRAATTAVQQLTRAGALKSKDILAPIVYAYPETIRRGTTVRLRFELADDSGKARATIRITRAGALRPLAVIRLPMRPVNPMHFVTVRWAAPKTLSPRLLMCVQAVDPSGNRTKNCATLTVK
jgi:hypothetical protein